MKQLLVLATLTLLILPAFSRESRGQDSFPRQPGSFLRPWSEDVPYPTPQEIKFPAGAAHYIVQDCDTDSEYQFLHETAVGVDDEGQLIVAWYNNFKNELVGKTLQRARRSSDGGKTWSEPEIVLDKDNDKGLMYVGIQFFNQDRKLYGLSNVEIFGNEQLVNCRLIDYDSAAKQWRQIAPIAPRFLAMQQPMLLDDGNYIVSGSYNPIPNGRNGIIPCVYISQGKDVSRPWRRVILADEYINVFAETAVVPDGNKLLAITRLENDPFPAFYESVDCGQSWRRIENKTFAASSSKFAAGKLRNGTRYILYNLPDFKRDENGKILTDGMSRNRRTLVIATAGPNDDCFTKIWKVSDNTTTTQQNASHYPCALERDGKLYVSYTGQHKMRNAALTVIPIDSLK